MPIETQRGARIVVEDIPTAIVCNKCGDRYDIADASNPEEGMQRFHSFVIHGGYATGFPRDLTSLDYILCASCLEDFVDSFKVQARLQPMMPSRREPRQAIRISDDHSLWVSDEWVSAHRSLAQDEGNPAWTPEDNDRPWPVLSGLYRVDGGDRTLEVVGNVLDVDDWNRPSVVFRALYESPTLWVTSLDDWTVSGMSLVHVGDPDDEIDEGDGSEDEQVTDLPLEE